MPASIRSRLGGVQGSILDVYGGEYEFDMYTVKLWNSRGQNRGVTLRYGKNITDLQQEQNISNTVTGVYPFYSSDEAYVELPEKTLSAPSAANYPFPRTVPLDCSNQFQKTPPTVAQLRTYANSYISRAGIGVPKVNIKLSFVNLRDALEYEDMAALERVELCDTLTVVFEQLGVETTAKVVKTAWDVLAERYNSIEVGDLKGSLATTIAETQEKANNAVTVSALETAVNAASNLITGVAGGYIRLNRDADGNPYELLIMDAEQEADAINIWRFNVNGWGFSRNGGASYTTAATIDGGIIADFITAGTLTGLNINNGNGTFQVDSAGNVTANSLTSNNATITGGSVQITAGSDTVTPLVVSGTYSYTTASYTNDVVYKAEVSRRGITVTESTWRYLTGGTKTTYPTSEVVTKYSGSGVAVETRSGNGSSAPTVTGDHVTLNTTSVRVLSGTSTTSPRVVMGKIPTVGSYGIYQDVGKTYPRFALNENGLFFYNASGTLTKSYPAT